jgi:transcriptional regulator with AAA-type ATPase domain
VKSSRIWKCEFGSGFSHPLLWLSKHPSLCSRVAELEQENARLQTLAQKSTSHDGNSRELMSEIEQLRAQLAAAEQRERELSSQLSKRSIPVKTELSEPRLTTSPSRHPVFPTQLKSSDKTSASLSLLVSLAPLKRICVSN